MRRRLVAVTTVGALTACLALAGPLAATAWSAPPPAGWTSVDLGTLGGARTDATDVNDKGHVVGQSQTADGRGHAFLWRDGVMTDLTPGAWQSGATAINERGEVAGYVQLVEGQPTQAFRWYRGTTTLLPGTEYGSEINERGQLGGTAQASEADPWTTFPFVWTSGTLAVVGPLTYPSTWTSSSIVDLNRSGTVLGRSEDFDDREVSYVWQDGTMTRLGEADGRFFATDLSDRGHVVGRASEADGLLSAVLWRDGAAEDLGTLPGDVWASANAVNEHDVVVGWSQGADPTETGRRAFVWADGYMDPIGVPDGAWSEASEVDDRGQVSGRIGYTRADGTGVQRAFAWVDGTLTPLGGEHRIVAVTDQSAQGHVLAMEYDDGVRAVLHVPPKRRS